MTTAMYEESPVSAMSTDEAIERANALVGSYDDLARTRWRIRALMDGGIEGIRALLGDEMAEEDLPWANLLVSGLGHLAQKIGSERPRPRVDPPQNRDSDTARKRAEKKERIVEGYDEADRMELQIPQVSRWMPGYGYGVWTVGSRDHDGYLYPQAELRDPYDCFPGEWGADQQPQELAVKRVIGPLRAKRRWPWLQDEINRVAGLTTAGVYDMSASKWENQRGRGLSVIEYYEAGGTHILLPQLSKRVDFWANPLRSGPAFVVAKRVAFNRLVGHYDHVIGLMAAMAKINIMSIIAMEDAVFTPTDVIGELKGQYRRGRFVTNVFPPGTKVEKTVNNMPYQLFEQLNRIERQFRLTASYPVTDDAQSPTSWTTGKGLDELNNTAGLEVGEYQRVLRWALQDLDAKRLEWDERLEPNVRKPFSCYSNDAYWAENYRPSSDIRGDYRTRRRHGFMSGWGDSAKVVGGVQLLGAGILDRITLQENLPGLENIPLVNERITADQSRKALMQALVGNANNGDPRATMLLIEMLPEGEEKARFKKFYTPEGPQLSPQEEAYLAQGGAPGGGGPQGPPPDIQTVLSNLPMQGAPRGGVQTVARV